MHTSRWLLDSLSISKNVMPEPPLASRRVGEAAIGRDAAERSCEALDSGSTAAATAGRRHVPLPHFALFAPLTVARRRLLL